MRSSLASRSMNGLPGLMHCTQQYSNELVEDEGGALAPFRLPCRWRWIVGCFFWDSFVVFNRRDRRELFFARGATPSIATYTGPCGRTSSSSLSMKAKLFLLLEILKSHLSHLLYDVCVYTGILYHHIILFLKQNSAESLFYWIMGSTRLRINES